MVIPGNMLTTAMGVMPHDDVNRALEQALSMDIPFWPQLPLHDYREDMYVQATEKFPGIVLDMEAKHLGFSMNKFMSEVEQAMEMMDDNEYMDISPEYSEVYHRFLAMELADRPAIRGQIEGPISVGLNVLDVDTDRPIIFDDTVRPFLVEFLAKRVNAQLKRLKAKNENAFMFVDEPGLQFVFSALSGYGDVAASKDMEHFFSLIERPRGVHLCGNPDWDFLLNLDMEVLSIDMYTNGETFVRYKPGIRRFLDRGGVLVWGIVPTNYEPFEKEGLETLAQRIEELWDFLGTHGFDKDQLLAQGLLSPATCCLVNPDREKTVEKSFAMVQRLSSMLRERYDLA